MSGWRDARLKKALDEAPDADARPSEAVREAILHKARLTAAAAAPRRVGWLLSFSRPWNSALATVGVVAFVGVLVWNQGLLQQHPEEAAPQVASAPAPAVSVAVVPQAPAVELAVEAKEMPQERRRAAARIDAPAVVMPSPEPVQAPKPMASSKLEQQQAPAQDSAVAGAVAPAPPPLPQLSKPVTTAAPPAMAYAPAPAPASMATARIAAREQSTEVTVNGSAVVRAWTALRLPTAQGPVLVQREQLPAGVADLLVKVLRAPASEGEAASGAQAQALSDKAALRAELVLGEQGVGLLEFGPNELRWTPAGQPTRVLRPAELAELRKALEAAAK